MDTDKIKINRESGGEITIKFELWNWINEDMFWCNFDEAFSTASDSVVECLIKARERFDEEWIKCAEIKTPNNSKAIDPDDFLDIDIEADVQCDYYTASDATITINFNEDYAIGDYIAEEWATGFVEFIQRQENAEEYDLDRVAGETLAEYMVEWPREDHDKEEIDNIFTRMEESGFYYDYEKSTIPIEEASETTKWRHQNRVMNKDQDCKLVQFLNTKELEETA